MSFKRFFERFEDPDHSLAVVNRSAPKPLQNMLESLFEGQPVDVGELNLPRSGKDVVLLLEDGEVIASSSMQELQDAILLVNSDLYITGARGIDELEIPDVIGNLDEIPFRLRGYPESNKEKLLLITISRYIERIAWDEGDGTLRASFQHLSRINDERGTRTVYEILARTDVDVHVYGIPDWTPPVGFDVTSHGAYTEELRDTWFVVYTPPEEGGEYAALVAIETSPREWEGFWTYRPELVKDINRYIERNM